MTKLHELLPDLPPMGDHSQPARQGSWQNKVTKVIHELVFGAEDGLISILGAVIGVALATHSNQMTLLAGVAAGVPGAISMAAGTYLGAKAETEVVVKRLLEEHQQAESNLEGEYQEMMEYYRQRGFSEAEIDVLIEGAKRNPDFLLEEMVTHELGISPTDLVQPLHRAIWMMVAYLAAMLIPIGPYALFPYKIAIIISGVGTILALMGIGALKTTVTGRSPWRSALEMALVATLAGGFGIAVGSLFTLLAPNTY